MTPRACLTCGKPSLTHQCLSCEQTSNGDGRADQVAMDQVVGPSRETLLHEAPTGFSSTQSKPPTRSAPLLGPDDLRGDQLRSLDQRPDVRAALDQLGVRDARDWAARVSGRDRPRSGPEYAVWKLDLLREADLIQPAPVALPALPATASPAAHALRDRFAVLLGLRGLRDDGDVPAPFTKRFAADWCGLSESAALRGLGELHEHGVIVRVGETRSRGGRGRASLYLPGRVEDDR